MRLLLLYIDGLVRDCNNAIANALELFVADTKYAEHTMHQCQIPSTSDDEKRNFFIDEQTVYTSFLHWHL